MSCLAGFVRRRNVYCHVVLNSSGFTVQKLPKIPLANLDALNWRDLANYQESCFSGK
jgi:hypothetical protein